MAIAMILKKLLIVDGSSPRQMWNGNQQQYPPQIPTRLDYSNQIQQQQQRLPPRQSSPSPKYSQAINNTYSSNSTVNTNNCKRKIEHILIIYLFNISTTK